MNRVIVATPQWCENCDNKSSANLVEVWGSISSHELDTKGLLGKRVSVRFHLCDDCKKLLAGWKDN